MGRLNPPEPSGVKGGDAGRGPPGRCPSLYMQLKLHPKPSQKPRRPLCSPPRPPLRGGGDWAVVRARCAPECGVEARDADARKFPLIPRQSGPRDPTPIQAESSVGGYAGIRTVWRPPPAYGATTGHTVQFGKRKSWGDTPDWRGKNGRGRELGGTSSRLGAVTAGEGSARAWVPAPPAVKPSSAASRAGKVRSLAPSNGCEQLCPASSAAAGRQNWGGGSCSTPPRRAPSARGGALLCPRRRCEGSAPTAPPARPPLRRGAPGGGQCPGQLGRRGGRRALADQPSPLPRSPRRTPVLLQRSGKFRGPLGAS